MPLETRDQAGEGTIDDRDYVRSLCEASDEAGFFALLKSIEPQAFSYARRYLGDTELAEDALQQANVNALNAFRTGRFDATKRLYPWYFSVVTNAAIDLLRRNKRHSGALRLDMRHAIGDEGAEGTLANLLAVDDDPSAHMEIEEARASVRASVDALPEALMDPIELHYWNGLKYREIADELGIPEGTVKSRMHAAVLKMRETIEKAA